MSTIGDRIKNLRIENGMSQTELANHIGVSKQTLYKYENNIITNVPSDKIEAIAAVFDVSPGQIMGWVSPEQALENWYQFEDAMQIAQFLYDNPEYKTVFDAVRKLKADDIQLVKTFIERMAENK